ncbi:MAG: GntP family permease [Planctomycetota bacterium]|nr:GntP family permease [Planctomycetota bacterium]MDA1214493.1 GntP family permease [Planctomycetota bacterium]
MSVSEFYGLCVLISGLLLLTVLVYRGTSIFVAGPLSAFAILVLSGADPVVGMNEKYMSGFADYLRQFYLIFIFGAAFGKLMEHSGAAISLAELVVTRLGSNWACLSVVMSCAIMTYGGVSLFVVGFSVYPLAVRIFRAADLPHRFIPAAIAFGSVTFTMTSAGSPEIQNLIPIRYLVSETGDSLTDPRAGWPASLIVSGLMFLCGQWYLERAIRREKRQGKGFVPSESTVNDQSSHFAGAPSINREETASRPGGWMSLVPLALTLLALNVFPALHDRFPEDPAVAIFIGMISAVVCFRRYLISVTAPLAEGFVNGLLAIGATCSVVGFGSALKGLPAFTMVVDWVTHLPIDHLTAAALAVAIISGIAGSASGGQGLALPIIKPIFVDGLGVAPRALHRVVAIASGSLDSLPTNGYIVMLIRHICGETHARSYGPIFVTTVLIPAVGTMLAIVLFRLFPAWGYM